MKGLLIKEFYTIRQQGKVMLALAAFYAIYAAAVKNVTMLSMILLVCVMIPITSMAYDEKNKWDKYALSMPVTRDTVVLSKYLFAILTVLAGILAVGLISSVAVLISGQMTIKEALLMSAAVGGVGLVFLAVIFPILFKFGVEKARLIMMLIFFLPMLLASFIPKLGIAPPGEQEIRLLSYAAPFLVLAALFLSLKISTAIYRKKEF